MKVLLIHTCATAGSVAVGDEAGVQAQVELGVRAASEELMPGVRRVLETAGWVLEELEAIGVVRGPGSFTGVRTGWGAGKGLCEALQIPLVGVSRLALLAGGVGLVDAVLDAGRGEFYHGRYRDGVCEMEALAGPDEIVLDGGRWVGSEEKVISGLGIEGVREPLAGDALALVLERRGTGVDDVLEDALYLRRTDAEIFAKPARVGWVMVRIGEIEDLCWVVGVARQVAESPQWGVEDYRRVLEGGGGAVRRRVYVWERGGFAVGMVMKSGEWCEGEIENVVVAPGARRRGIGRALCGAVVEWCFAERASVVRLEVRESNVGAIKLYQGLGFTATGVRRGYYREPVEDGLVMETQSEGAHGDG